jgi:hypothetical protein
MNSIIPMTTKSPQHALLNAAEPAPGHTPDYDHSPVTIPMTSFCMKRLHGTMPKMRLITPLISNVMPLLLIMVSTILLL